MSLGSILGGLLDPVKDIVSEVVVDKDKRDQINLELAKLEDEAQARLDGLQEGQIEVNKVEAASGSVFVAGWRPAIGWVGAAGLAYSFVLEPFMEFTALQLGYSGAFPQLPTETMLTLVLAMLGVGTMRTVEKIKGVSTNNMQDVPSRGQPVQEQETSVEVRPSGTVTVDQKSAPRKRKKFKIF